MATQQRYKIRRETRFVNGCPCPIFYVFYLSSRGMYEMLSTERTLKAAKETIASYEFSDNYQDDEKDVYFNVK